MHKSATVDESAGEMEYDEREIFSRRIIERSNTLYAIAHAMLKNRQDAMDAVQDAVLKAWEKRGALRDENAFSPWLNRILINTCKNRLRAKRPAVELYDVPAKQTGDDDNLDIRRAMASLDDKTRVCAALFYYEDMPIKCISATLGISQGTVKSRLNRARKKLRELLEVR